jgi:hypothetical protein
VNVWSEVPKVTRLKTQQKTSPNARNALGLEIACLVGLWIHPWQRPVEKSLKSILFFGDRCIMSKVC